MSGAKAAGPIHARARPTRRRGQQRGQALVWLLGTLAASASVLYAVYNVGQLHTAKDKTVNAADAAALAGATVEARMLNLIAYNNRSMMANEVMLVQMLSIESWLGYFKTTSQNIGTVLDFIPYLDIIGELLTENAQVAGQLRDDAVKPAINAIVGVLEVAKTGFKLAHGAVVLGGSAVAQNAATRVVEANKAAFGTHSDAGVEVDNRPTVLAATFALNADRWIKFSKLYSNADRTDARQVLLDSRDAFSVNRPGSGLVNASLALVGLEKQGGTKLQGFDRWESEDTLELWTWAGKKKYVPIGWGRANADRNGSSGTTWSPNRTAQKLAYGDGGSGHSYRNWSGVPSVYDIADKTKADRATLGIDFFVAVRRPLANTKTTSQLGVGSVNASLAGSPDMPERLQGDQLSALSKARVSFQRPQRNAADRTGTGLFRADSAIEYGSLFSPYWQARLDDLTPVEKAGLMTAMGMNPLEAPFTPGGQK